MKLILSRAMLLLALFNYGGFSAFAASANHDEAKKVTKSCCADEQGDKKDCCEEGCNCCEGGECTCENCGCCGEGGCSAGVSCCEQGCCQGGECNCENCGCCQGGSCGEGGCAGGSCGQGGCGCGCCKPKPERK